MRKAVQSVRDKLVPIAVPLMAIPLAGLPLPALLSTLLAATLAGMGAAEEYLGLAEKARQSPVFCLLECRKAVRKAG